MITFASSHTSRSEPTVFAPPEIWENCMIIISYCKYMSCSRKLMTKFFAYNSRHQHEEDDREVHVGWRLKTRLMATTLKKDK